MEYGAASRQGCREQRGERSVVSDQFLSFTVSRVLAERGGVRNPKQVSAVYITPAPLR